MRQFLDLARENMALRLKVEEGIKEANKNFVIAKAGMSEQTLNTALMAPKHEVYLDTGKRNVMSVDIPVFQSQTRTADANDIIVKLGSSKKPYRVTAVFSRGQLFLSINPPTGYSRNIQSKMTWGTKNFSFLNDQILK